MIIFFFFIIRVLCMAAAIILLYSLFTNQGKENWLSTLNNGIKEGLRGCGFKIKKSEYSIELYRWVITDPENVCDDGLDRANWPAMDIADWMKVGLPGTPEADTECGEDCTCELRLYKKMEVVRD